MADDFKFEDAEVNTDGLVFSSPEVMNKYSGDVLENRVQKYNLAGDLDPTMTRNMLESGNENSLLEALRSMTRQRQENTRLRMIDLAAQRQRPDIALAASSAELSVPSSDSILEQNLADKFTSSLPALMSPAFTSDLIKDAQFDDSPYDEAIDKVNYNFTRKEVFSSLAQEWSEKIKDKSIAGSWSNLFSSDFAEMFVPGLSMYRFNQAARSLKDRGFLTSTNMEELINDVMTKPSFTEAKTRANEIIQGLFDSNVYDAAAFLKGLESYSVSDRHWDNTMNALDVATVPGVGTLAKATRKAASSVSSTAINLSGINLAAGNIQAAAKAKAVDKFVNLAKATGNDQSVDAMLSTVPTLFNPKTVVNATPNLDARAADRIARNLETNRDQLIATVNDAISVKRLDQDTPALSVALKEAEAKVRTTLKHYSSAILDVKPINSDDTLANVAGVQVAIGRAERREPVYGLSDIRGEQSLGNWDSYQSYVKHLQKSSQHDPQYRVYPNDSLYYRQAVQDGYINPPMGKDPVNLKKLNATDLNNIDSKSYRSYLENLKKNANIDPDYAIYPSEAKFNPTNKTLNNYTRAVKDGFIIRTNRAGVVNKSMLDIIPEPGKIQVETSFGKVTGDLFDHPQEAISAARSYGLDPRSYTVREYAPQKFYLSVIQHIDETTPNVADALKIQLQGVDQNDWNTIILRRLGSAEELNGTQTMSANRKIATHGTSDILNAIADHIENTLVKPLRKEERANLKSFMEYQRDYEDPTSKVIGKFSNSQLEFENEWRQQFGKFPTQAESQAYWGQVQISDYDWVLRALSDYTQMSSAGWQNLLFKKYSEVPVEAKLIKDISDVGLSYVPKIGVIDNGVFRLIKREDIKDLTDQGFLMYQIHSQGQRKLESVKKIERNVEIILSKDGLTSPLSWDNRVAYSPGGHRVHIDDWFASVPIIDRKTGTQLYMRDFNLSSHMSRKQIEIYVNNWNKARDMYIRNDNALDAFVDINLPETGHVRFRQLYDDGVLDPRDLVRIRRNGTNLWDAHQLTTQYKNIQRSSSSLDEAREQTAYLSAKGQSLPSLTYQGTANNPVVRIGSARMLDPMRTLASTLNSNVRNLYMDDMKIKHAQDFMARFGHLVEVQDEVHARLNPVYYAIEAPFKEHVNDLHLLSAAKNYRVSIKHFVGIENEEQALVRTFRERMLDTVYNRFGLTAAEVAENYLSPRIKDPAKFLRSMAFHSSVGLFNPASFFTQLGQFAHIFALAPKDTAKAMAWLTYHNYLTKANPAIHNSIAQKLTAWGSSPQEFQEFTEAYRRLGIGTVRGEVAELDDLGSIKFAQSAAGRFLEWGRKPFDWGELMTRKAAFASAFLEWKNLNKGSKLTDDAIRSIAQRTDIMTGTMTRASISSKQTGMLSVPLQFANWHIRLADQMLGKSLTTAEKSRIILTNTVLYGAPAGLASYGVASFFPWKQSLDTLWTALGIDPKEPGNDLFDIGINGGVQYMMRTLTGDGFNPQERFGPGVGNIVLNRIFDDQNTFMDVILGPAVQPLKGMFNLTLPIIANVGSRVILDDQVVPLDVGDLLKAGSEMVATLNKTERMIGIMNTGKYISKNEKYIADIDGWKGAVEFFTGLKTDQIETAGNKNSYLKGLKTLQEKYTPIMTRTHKAMLDAMRREDWDAATNLETKLRSYYAFTGMTPEEISKFEYRLFQGYNRSFIDSVDQRLMKRGGRQTDRILREQERQQRNPN